MLLPVESIVAPLIENLSRGNVILSAPPGAGKSTFLPLKLLEAIPGKIIMLQPRRVAVRAIAGFLAQQLGEKVGESVGYRIRGEAMVGAKTRIEIVTEGLLTRMLQQDPELPGVSVVIFDEFHERNLHADFALALCLEAQSGLREDLRLLVMSATLELQPLQQLMPQAASLQSEGRSFPVDVHYRPYHRTHTLVTGCASLVTEVLEQQNGSVLVFLPGAWEIQQVEALLKQKVGNNTLIAPLFGSLSKQQQVMAIEPAPTGKRKVVLATNIAETSLTIDGITLVVDSGQEKVANFNLARGVTQLQKQQVSKASSTQRAGRAGRLAPGMCFRMWSEESQSRLREQRQPEILQADLSGFLLEAKMWGTDLEQLALLDQPTSAQLEFGYGLLQQLSALDQDNKLTAHGRKMAAMGCHPRLANMLIQSAVLSIPTQALAAVLVALLEANDKPRSSAVGIAVERMLDSPRDPKWRMAKQWMKRLGIAADAESIRAYLSDLPILLAMAFPDHIAMHRGKGRYQMANGSGAEIARDDALFGQDFLAVGQLLLTDQANAKISLAEPIALGQLEEHFGHLIETRPICQWEDKRQRILSETRRQLGACVLNTEPGDAPTSEMLIALWCELIRQNGLAFLGWDDLVLRWRQKYQLASDLFSDQFSCPSDDQLLESLEAWLGPYLGDVKSLKALKGLDWMGIMKNQLDWQQQQKLDALFPSHFKVPTGNNHRLRYEDNGDVTLAVKMQEVYGMSDTPSIAGGRVPLVLELLSPAGRPLQKTRDLKGFWQGSYQEVKKEMKGRYPKHFWPDDPSVAKATSKTKKHM